MYNVIASRTAGRKMIATRYATKNLLCAAHKTYYDSQAYLFQQGLASHHVT